MFCTCFTNFRRMEMRAVDLPLLLAFSLFLISDQVSGEIVMSSVKSTELIEPKLNSKLQKRHFGNFGAGLGSGSFGLGSGSFGLNGGEFGLNSGGFGIGAAGGNGLYGGLGTQLPLGSYGVPVRGSSPRYFYSQGIHYICYPIYVYHLYTLYPHWRHQCFVRSNYGGLS